ATTPTVDSGCGRVPDVTTRRGRQCDRAQLARLASLPPRRGEPAIRSRDDLASLHAPYVCNHLADRVVGERVREPAAGELHELRGRFRRRTGIERRLRIVLDTELYQLGHLRTVHTLDEAERHVDTAGDTRGRDDLAALDNTLRDVVGTELLETLLARPMCR